MEGLVSLLTLGTVQGKASICNLYVGEQLRPQIESSFISCV